MLELIAETACDATEEAADEAPDEAPETTLEAVFPVVLVTVEATDATVTWGEILKESALAKLVMKLANDRFFFLLLLLLLERVPTVYALDTILVMS